MRDIINIIGRHWRSLEENLSSLSSFPEIRGTFETVHIDGLLVGKLVETLGTGQEHLFYRLDVGSSFVRNNTAIIASRSGQSDTHDAQIPTHTLSGHTHPNTVLRQISPPSSFDIHAMACAMRTGFTEHSDNHRIVCSHLVVTRDGIYTFSIHPIWATQERSVLDWKLQEMYQDLDFLTGGVPQTRRSPPMCRDQYLLASTQMGIDISYMPHTAMESTVRVLYTSPKQIRSYGPWTASHAKPHEDTTCTCWLLENPEPEYPARSSRRTLFDEKPDYPARRTRIDEDD